MPDTIGVLPEKVKVTGPSGGSRKVGQHGCSINLRWCIFGQ
jgi:hypothetical protein